MGSVTAAEPIVSGDNIGKLILRVTVAVLLLFHGIAKIKGGIGWMGGMLAQYHIPAFVGYGVYVAEVVAPILLIIGILTRPAALVIAFNMVMAILLVQRNKLFALTPQGGAWAVEIEMFFLATAVAIFFLGSGTYAVSRGRGRWD